MADPPICREQQYTELLNAIEYQEHLIIVSGPISSGKTITIKSVIDTVKSHEVLRTAHVYCDTEATTADILTDVITQLTGSEGRPRSVSSITKFLQTCPKDMRAIVVFDSFDHLEQEAVPLFQKIEAIVDQHLLETYSFIFVSHSDPQFFNFTPLIFFNVLFPAYSRRDLVRITSATLERPERLLTQVIDICAPIFCDIRDIVFVVHTLGDDLDKSPSFIGKRILNLLDTMRSQQISRVNDLARTASALLIAVYIGSKTTISSDLLRFARTLQKKKREVKMLEEHETIAVERAFAIAKSIIFSHLGQFETDFSLHLQLQKLVELGLLEIRGDIYGDPRVKCLASEQEVTAVAGSYDIKLHEYLS